MVSKKSIVYVSTALALIFVIALAFPVVAGAVDPAPVNLRVGLPTSSNGGCLRLAWEAPDAGAVGYYRIYRSLDESSGFEQVFEGPVNGMSGREFMDYIDAGLEDGNTYYYKVTLLDRHEKELGTTPVAEGVLPEREAADTGGLSGKRIIISVADQTIYFLEDEVLIKQHLCSTGTDSHPTPIGVFQVLYHQYLLISERYGDAYCYWWMGFYTDTGMHAIPYDPDSGTWIGASSLGHKASHGCVRQAVADAEWAYKWAPDGTRIDVIGHSYKPPERPPPPPPPITGGHGSRAISMDQSEWYMAEGCTTGSFDMYVLMMNPTPVVATVQADYMKTDGTVVSETYAVPPISRYTVHVNDIFGLDECEMSTRLRADTLIVAERSMYFDYNGRLGGSNSAAVAEPATVWYLAEGYTGNEFDEYVLIQNPGDTDQTVYCHYMRSDGQSVFRDYYVLAHSRYSVHVDDMPELSNAEVSTRVSCDEPIIVERAQYFNYYGRNGGNASTGVTEAAKKWYLAEGYTGGDFDEYVLIQNPNDEDGLAEVTFLCSDGSAHVYHYDLLPWSRFTIHVDEVPELASAEVSTVVEASVDVIVERSMYFVSYQRPGGSDAQGVNEPSRHWFLAEGYTGGEYDTYVLVMNPNDEDAFVDVSYLMPGGAALTANYLVAPHSRYTIHLDAIEGLTDTEVATTLTGDRPIVCERAMYFSIPRE